jgi:hypothetical protein
VRYQWSIQWITGKHGRYWNTTKLGITGLKWYFFLSCCSLMFDIGNLNFSPSSSRSPLMGKPNTPAFDLSRKSLRRQETRGLSIMSAYFIILSLSGRMKENGREELGKHCHSFNSLSVVLILIGARESSHKTNWINAFLSNGAISIIPHTSIFNPPPPLSLCGCYSGIQKLSILSGEQSYIYASPCS